MITTVTEHRAHESKVAQRECHHRPSRISKLLLAIPILPKIQLVNIRCFDFRRTFRLPVLISHKVRLLRLRDAVDISPDEPVCGMRIGLGSVGILHKSRSRTIWKNEGELTPAGRAFIGFGLKSSIGREAKEKHIYVAETTLRCP